MSTVEEREIALRGEDWELGQLLGVGVQWWTAGKDRTVQDDDGPDCDGPDKVAMDAEVEGTGGDCETASHSPEVDVSCRARVLSASDIYLGKKNHFYPCTKKYGVSKFSKLNK